MATNPPIIVADEPTGNLDSHSADKIIDLFSGLVQEGKTIILVTHDASITKRTQRTLIISDGEIINEAVAHALPMLNHTQMLDVTHHLKHMEISSGDTIIQKGQHIDDFFIVVRGQVEIVLAGLRRHEAAPQHLGAGEFFGEVELIRGSDSIADVRATSDGPVELVTLSHKDFSEMLASSPATEESLSQIAQSRLANKHTKTRRFLWW